MFEQSDHLAALHDAEVAKELRSILGTEFPIRLGVKLDVDGRAWSASIGAALIERILVAVGRPPVESLPRDD